MITTEAGLPRLNMRDLRYMFARFLLEQDFPLKQSLVSLATQNRLQHWHFATGFHVRILKLVLSLQVPWTRSLALEKRREKE